MKKYLIFDLDWTLIESMWGTINLVIEMLLKIEWTDVEKAKYIFSTTSWTPLLTQIEMLYEWFPNVDCKKLTQDIYNEILKLDTNFFPWVLDKISELKNDYKLYLTTWNSTLTAEKHLKNGWIYEYFQIVLWSDEIHKWELHLEIFEEHSNDTDFYKKSIYIWDWDSDRMFAKQKWIDFIHIWNDKIDKYEINSVREIDKVLKLFNN